MIDDWIKGSQRRSENILSDQQLSKFKIGCMSGQSTDEIDQHLLCTFRTRLAKPTDPHTVSLGVDLQNVSSLRLPILKLKVLFMSDKSKSSLYQP